MSDDVVITGYGVLTAFGFGADAVRSGVFGGGDRFRPIERFDTARFRTDRAAVYSGDGVPGVTISPLETPAQAPVLRACVVAALEMAGHDGSGAPLLLGSAGDRRADPSFWQTPGTEPPLDSLPGQLAHRIGADLGLGTPRLAYVNACIASTTAIITGAQLVRGGHARAAVCAGVHMVSADIFAKFDSGQAMSTDGAVRPFSLGRTGLLHGDGAAALVLESAASAAQRGATVLGRLTGWGMAADGHHVVRPHPDGAGLAAAARAALRMAGREPSSVDYVNAHGTGTAFNDSAETRGLREVFGPGVTVSSTKSTTGHLLEATGAVEAVITLLALADGVLPPTMGYLEPDPECDVDCVPNASRVANIRVAVSLNAAFGGANAALVLERAS
ncbi:beta-ketoacyl-[acyl-carrier-protein] synthase family protein [Actinokineospora diospyrosa]|uniref:3-oxoacyl-[acyl-carrier-protein] synthase II n=1 Tax=Actinokineospora diospyrosa TaxID=103728 RepID=A0ABT1IMK2_9PSEU|nr:beta-ketoacyl synthase N-terminal-like domain-containing protein [Actinokineospora diospyrosa]MCP2273892.1 3-oxoacyl-[acyl-carrier-protein] synthase II [Actinokineospora diospyrosa]